MNYNIIVNKKSSKFISKQPKIDRIRIYDAINNLPHGDIVKMAGYEDWYRLRVGNYRIIYTIEHNRLIIRVIKAGNRGDVYN